jgi:hypothetical protein
MDQRLLRILGGETEHYPYALENKYPRFFGKIMALWDKPEIDDYFMDLVVDRRGSREGFPQEVCAEIVHLSLVHAAHHEANQKTDVWDVASSSFVDYASGATPEESSAWREPPESTRVAIQNLGVNCSSDGFFQAAESGNRAVVGLFLDAKVNTEIRNERGWTALMHASFNGHDATVELLIKHDADVFTCDAGGNTALHWAAFSGYVNCAKLLIANHADVDARNSFGWTPLLQTTARRHLEVVMLLINHGANLDIVARDGNTALHKAAVAGYSEIIRPLLAHNADTSMKNLDGDTAVKLAIKNKHDQVIKLLLSAPKQQ